MERKYLAINIKCKRNVNFLSTTLHVYDMCGTGIKCCYFDVFHFSCTLPLYLMDSQLSVSCNTIIIITLYCRITYIINLTRCLHALLGAALKLG